MTPEQFPIQNFRAECIRGQFVSMPLVSSVVFVTDGTVSTLLFGWSDLIRGPYAPAESCGSAAHFKGEWTPNNLS